MTGTEIVEAQAEQPTPVDDVGQDLCLIARSPAEMRSAQQRLKAWCAQKVAIVTRDADEAELNLRIARTNHWKTPSFERQARLARKRREFYEKMAAAVDAGYSIVPNFPVDVFAVRTKRRNPSPRDSAYRDDNRQHHPEGLRAGEGRHVDPLPFLATREEPEHDNKGNVLRDTAGKVQIKRRYWSTEFDEEIEFPISVAKPEIMTAAQEAMALKVFDELGVLPMRRKEDPIVVGRIHRPGSSLHDPKFVTFLVAWYIDTADL